MQPTGEWLNQPGGLAERLRLLRKVAGLTGDQLASQLRWPRSKIPKLENGRQMPSESDITAWTTACGHPDAAPALLESLSEAQVIHHQWRHRLRSGHPALQDDFDVLVGRASRIRNFEILLIPGLLQTPDYARYRMLEAVRLHGTAADQVEATVTARMRRQAVLYDTSKTFEFVITEAALQYLLCPPDVLLGQLDRLHIASALGNVTLGIIPPGKELTIAPMAGFLITDDTTILETFTSMDTYQGAESAAYHRYADELLAQSVTGESARSLITSAAAELRTLPRLPPGDHTDGRRGRPAQFAAFSQMLCTCAYNAAQAGDRVRALELITDAERAATRLPAHAVPGQPFTVTSAQVALYKVGVHWSLGDAGTAIAVGRSLRPAQFPTAERRGRLHTDLARAWWQWGKPEPTAQQLLAALQQAPGEVRDRPSIRKIAVSLIHQHPRVCGVRELATAIGKRQ